MNSLYRITTNGLMYSYKNNLMGSYKKLNDAMEKVETHREFNSYAEDPAAAAKAFQTRRAQWRTDSQLSNNETVLAQVEQAMSTLDKVKNDLGRYLGEDGTLRGLNTPTGSGRQALGQTIVTAAEAAVQSMNTTYGENFLFAGADALNVPLTWGEDGQLLYRGVAVDSAQGSADHGYLEAMADEKTYVDLGLGMKEDKDGNAISSSMYNNALSALTFLDYGVDADGDPKNVISLMKKIGEALQATDPDTGDYSDEAGKTEEDVNRLCGKLKDALDRMGVEYVELDTQATFLKTNDKRLTTLSDTLEKQRSSLEDIDPVAAISSMMWAQYCYNAALRIGNSVLSQSLIDYMN